MAPGLRGRLRHAPAAPLAGLRARPRTGRRGGRAMGPELRALAKTVAAARTKTRWRSEPWLPARGRTRE
eukprot:5133657-Lingulodinium_polyedra.AAC.1